jgi:hypothetical protein
MEPLTAARILRIWECGAPEPPIARALTILAEAEPSASRPDLAALPLGRRDERLLAVREGAFGRRFEALVSCPGCGERLNLDFSAEELRAGGSVTRPEPPPLRLGEYELAVRLPDSADLAAAAACPDVASARRLLARRSIRQAQRAGVPVDPHLVPEELLPALARHLEEADPDADRTLESSCPGCGTTWESAFDIASFLWSEIEAEALRLLNEVHRLARAYGWREADILEMSPLRRRAYLELVP